MGFIVLLLDLFSLSVYHQGGTFVVEILVLALSLISILYATLAIRREVR
jgi:cell division protein FtsL